MKLATKRTKTENLFETMAKKAPVGIYIVRDGKFCYTNPTFWSTTGYEEDELLGRDSLELIIPEDREMVRENVIKMLKGELTSPCQFRVARKDGSIRWVVETVASIRHRGRQATLGYFVDITEHKQMEEALRQSEENYRALFDSLVIGTFVLDAETMKVVVANQVAAKIFGFSSVQEIVGVNPLDFLPSDDRKRAFKIIVKDMFEQDLRRTHEWRAITKDGREIWLSTVGARVLHQGRLAGLISFVDVTERKQMEEALNIQRTYFQQLFDNSPDAMIMATIDARVIQTNRGFETLFGYSPGETKGRYIKELIIPEDRVHELAETLQAISKGKAFLRKETMRRDKNSNLVDVSILTYPISFDGKVVGAYTIYTDVTERKRMEEALRRSEENYRALFDSLVIGTFVLDAETMKVVVANQVAAKIFGFSSVEEARGADPLDFVHPEEQERVREIIMEELFKQDLRTTDELRAITKDGRVIWISAVGARVLYQGRLAGLISFVDITERKKMEEALNIQRVYFQQLFDNSPDAIIMMDTDERIIQVNRGFKTLFGYSLEEIKGQHIKELIVPENCVHELAERMQAILKGKAFRKETVRRDKNGNLVDVSLLGYPISFDGKVVGAYVVYTNITERKRMEEALKLAAEKWRETFDSISDAVIIADTDFRIQRVNKAFADLFHVEIRQVVGKHCYELLHCEDKSISGCPHRQTWATKKPATAEFYNSYLEKYLLESTSPIFDKQGEVVGTVHITRDITAQKLQTERLMRTDRLASIGELAAGTAHELNNPLTSIIGFSQLLMEKEVPDDIRENLELIHSEAQRVASITNNLLTFARKHTPLKRRSQINNIIEDVLKLRAYEHKVNNIKVEKQLDPDVPEIMVDYFQMQQVFLNIIINAEYFMTAAHNRGTLNIITQKRNDTVKILFADDGPGIPPENLTRIFDPFFTTKPPGRGTGLGLSICHGIVTEHGGQIYARSRLGKGAIFVIELPVNGKLSSCR